DEQAIADPRQRIDSRGPHGVVPAQSQCRHIGGYAAPADHLVADDHRLARQGPPPSESRRYRKVAKLDAAGQMLEVEAHAARDFRDPTGWVHQLAGSEADQPFGLRADRLREA